MTGFSSLSRFPGDGLPSNLNSLMVPRKAIGFAVPLAYSFFFFNFYFIYLFFGRVGSLLLHAGFL